ncbi:hypothetical protein DOT_2647 [Desulfosporosinus sp. OT]|nr:hypothetical protein DOT_2647 [Desulfosporosinus sp. OT]
MQLIFHTILSRDFLLYSWNAIEKQLIISKREGGKTNGATK